MERRWSLQLYIPPLTALPHIQTNVKICWWIFPKSENSPPAKNSFTQNIYLGPKNWTMCVPKWEVLILFSQCINFGSASYLLTFLYNSIQLNWDNFMRLTHIVGTSFFSIQIAPSPFYLWKVDLFKRPLTALPSSRRTMLLFFLKVQKFAAKFFG